MSAVLEKETQNQPAPEALEQVVPSHIVIGPDGQARVAGTGYKVRLMAGWHRFRGYTPEQMQEGHPDLTMAQVYSVLAYYYDHKEEMDADMDRRNAMVEKMRAEAGEDPLVKRLREAGLWPLPPGMTPEQVSKELKARTQHKQAAQEQDCLA